MLDGHSFCFSLPVFPFSLLSLQHTEPGAIGQKKKKKKKEISKKSKTTQTKIRGTTCMMRCPTQRLENDGRTVTQIVPSS